MPEQFWLMKSEPSECSIDDLAAAPKHTVAWVGVRNHQARNFMRDRMRINDGVLVYHSSCAEPGVAGAAYTDATQFDSAGPYFDPTAAHNAPRWLHVDVKLTRKTRLLSLQQMRREPGLSSMQVLRRGNRLSITPVAADEWLEVIRLLDRP